MGEVGRGRGDEEKGRERRKRRENCHEEGKQEATLPHRAP